MSLGNRLDRGEQGRPLFVADPPSLSGCVARERGSMVSAESDHFPLWNEFLTN